MYPQNFLSSTTKPRKSRNQNPKIQYERLCLQKIVILSYFVGSYIPWKTIRLKYQLCCGSIGVHLSAILFTRTLTKWTRSMKTKSKNNTKLMARISPKAQKTGDHQFEAVEAMNITVNVNTTPVTKFSLSTIIHINAKPRHRSRRMYWLTYRNNLWYSLRAKPILLTIINS